MQQNVGKNQNKSSAVAEMDDHFAIIDMGQNDMGREVGVAVPLSAGELGPHLTQPQTNSPQWRIQGRGFIGFGRPFPRASRHCIKPPTIMVS